MNIAQIRKYDVANGPGIRTTIFVSGCTHKCKNCFNEEYQDFSYGNEFGKATEDKIVKMVKETKRLSVLGGEPFQQNIELANLLTRIKKETDASIWVWSGYTFEEILDISRSNICVYNIISNIDVLVDGPFIESKKDLTLKFRGSSNQRIIDVKRSFKENKVVLMEEFYN